MRVLILSVTAGTGHNSTAKALSDYFASINVESEVFDTYQHISGIIAKSIDKGYNVSTKSMGRLYATMYSKWEHRKKEKDYDKNSPMRAIHSLVSSKIHAYIEEYVPDAIVSTHPLAAMLMDILKKKNMISVPVYCILTDFTVLPYFEEARHLDYLVTATELLNPQAFKKGYKRSQILPFGIPINPKFAKHESKQKMRKMLGLDQNKFTILLMGGGIGYGNMFETFKKIDALNIDCQIIVVCGRNEKAKAKIGEIQPKKQVLCLGFVDNVEQLMDASDCIITKPGGLSTSEAFAKNLPIIMINPIPGQEERNTEFLLNNGVAMNVTKTCPLDEVIFQFFFFPEKIENMKRNISLLRRPNSTRDICEFIANEYKNKLKESKDIKENKEVKENSEKI
ncbi:MAG: glycosyltransferase [Oscillospiraceae bacterium]|nr:glycosyltransferase [Oscillospiraceae bacterium]